MGKLTKDEASDYLVTSVARGGIAIGVIAGTLMQSWWVSGPVAVVLAALAIHALLNSMKTYLGEDHDNANS